MKLKFLLLTGLLIAALAPLPAATIVYVAMLTGPAENPPNTSPGFGFTTITIDDVLHSMRVEATFGGLEGNTAAAHVHIGRPAGGVVTSVPTFPGFPLGVTSGSYDMTFDTLTASTYNPSFLNNALNMGVVANAEAALFAGFASGDAYLNLHSTVYPGGEIRGFLTQVPEPATYAMGGAALAAMALLRRRRVNG